MNDLLGRELGYNVYGEPLYKWEYSENVHRPKVVVDDLSRPVVRWVKKPGSALETAEPITFIDKAWPWLNHQWCITLWCEANPEEWVRMYGNALVCPDRGFTFPTNITLPRGMVPDMEGTEEFIRIAKKERKRTNEERIEESERALDKWDKMAADEVDGELSELVPAFGNIWPGSRSTCISFPSRDSVRNHDQVFKGEN